MSRPTLSSVPDPHDRDVITEDLTVLVRRAAHALRPREAFADPAEAARSASPRARRADMLALLSATEVLRAALEDQAAQWARSLGSMPSPPTYADLGAAVGITRQAARSRWPEALPDARPGRPRDTRPRWQRYLDAVGEALHAAGVHTRDAWAETTGTDDDRGQMWEGAVDCGDRTLAWNEDRGWWVITTGDSVRDLAVAVDAPAGEVVAAALEHLAVLVDRRPDAVEVGDRVRDGEMLWQVAGAPLVLPDGTVAVPVHDTVDPEQTTQLVLSPDATLKIER